MVTGDTGQFYEGEKKALRLAPSIVGRGDTILLNTGMI